MESTITLHVLISLTDIIKPEYESPGTFSTIDDYLAHIKIKLK